MTAVIYPSAQLPQPQYKPRNTSLMRRQISTEIGKGPNLFRNVATSTGTVLPLTWYLSMEEFKYFCGWFENDLVFGNRPFELKVVNPNGERTLPAFFFEGYDFKLQSMDVVEVSAVVEVAFDPVGNPAPPAPLGTSWDSANMSANGVLSNGDLTFTVNSAAYGAVLCTKPIAGDKRYFEIVCNFAVNPTFSTSVAIGVVPQSLSSALLTTYPPDGFYYEDYLGTAYASLQIVITADNYAIYSANNGYANLSVVSVIIDHVNKIVQFESDNFLNYWNLNDPDNQAELISPAILTEDWIPFVFVNSPDHVFTLRTQLSEFTMPVPIDAVPLGDP